MQSLHTLTDGNPFYSDEVVRLLVAQGRIDQPLGERLPLPDGVRDAIRRRLLPLRPEVLEALQVAAVEGRDFELATLERAAGIDRADLLERLDEALAVQLLEEAPGPAGSFRFAHGLIRETLYGDLSATRRARLHAAVGEALERTTASEAELAHHFVEAAPRRRPRQGARARPSRRERGAGGTRLRARRRPLRRSAGRPRPAARARRAPARRAAALRGQAQMQAGGDAARSTLLAAIELARRMGDSELLARAALSLGGYGLSPGMVDDDVVAVLEEALEGLSPDGSALRARLLVRLAVALYYSDTAPRREELVQEALGIAAASTTRRRWPTSSTRGRSPPTGPTPPSVGWPGRSSSSRSPTPPATRRSASARARRRSTCCSSSTTSPAPTWRSRRWTASPPSRATRAPAPTSRCTAPGGR